MPLFLLALLLLCLAAPRADADEPRVRAQRFEAAPHAGDLISVRAAGARTTGFTGGLLLSYAKDPLRVVDRRFDDPASFRIVDQHLVGDLFASFAAWRWFSAGLTVPVVLMAGGERGIPDASRASGGGVGDLRLHAQFLIIPRDDEGFGLGLEATVAFPTTAGTGPLYAGSPTISGTPWLVMDYRYRDTLVALNLGYRIQGPEEIAGYELAGGPVAGLGLRQGFLDGDLGLLGELLFSTNQADLFGTDGNILEGSLGLDVCVGDWGRAYLAGGGGFAGGIGEPSFRVTSGWRIQRCKAPPPPPPPPPDRDGDGVVDADDACPDRAGATTGDPKTNGCPPDTDGDGVFDADDACPEVAGVMTDAPKTTGCPPDGDGDGIVDADDACPEKAGVETGDPKTNGCPPDGDGDGIVDADDACPAVAGDPAEDPKRHGCPAPKVTKEAIIINDRIEFRSGSAELLPESLPIVDAVARVILEHPEVEKVTVEGHTDDTDTVAFNQKLSQRRAEAVRDYLAGKGVANERMEAKGYGQSRPVASNDTEEGRRANRRVEFKVTMKEGE